MIRFHPPQPSAVALAVLAAVTSFLTLMSWDGLSDDASAYLVPLFWICAATAAAGLALRALRLPMVLVPVLQALGIALVLHHAWAGDVAVAGWLPTPASVVAMVDVLNEAATAGASWAAPVPAEVTRFSPLMIFWGSVVVLLVDVLACSFRRVSLAGLPLLAAFTVPVSILGGVAWGTFAIAAAGFVFLLAADQAARLGPWGRNLAGTPSALLAGEVGDSQPHQVRLSTLGAAATRLGLAGIGVAVVVPLVLPSGDGFLGDGSGSGDGSGNDGVQISNPMVNMKRDLVRGEDVPLLRVRTDDPDPGYLRLTALDEFDGTAWRPRDRDIPVTNRANGQLPVPPGLQSPTPRVQRRSEIQIFPNFASTWLPVPYPATEIHAAGDWRYDAATLDVVSAEKGLTAAGEDYQVTALDVQPSAAELADAAPPSRSIALADTRLPSTMPDWLRQRADEVTAGAQSDFERAVRLQDWFRERGGFTYSLARSTTGSSVDDLARFLGSGEDSRTGYCEQFASAMAMMARALGIPARVAVGFLRPSPEPDGSWVYSSHDLHAWPELYFTGVGWVRFEPTPQSRADEVPSYTRGQIPQPGAIELPSTLPSAAQPSRTAAPAPDQGTTTDTTAKSTLPSWWWVPLAVLVLLGLAVLPFGLRALARRSRFGQDDPSRFAEGAWAELRATALDLGLGWRDGATLRRCARDLVPSVRPWLPHTARAEGVLSRAEAVEALERLVLLVERARYSRSGLATVDRAEVRQLVSSVSAALHESASPRARRRAMWLPRSLWRSRSQVPVVPEQPGVVQLHEGVPRSDRVSV